MCFTYGKDLRLSKADKTVSSAQGPDIVNVKVHVSVKYEPDNPRNGSDRD